MPVQDASTNISTDVLLHSLAQTVSPLTITDANQPDDPIVYVNDAFLALSGYTKEEIIGKNCRFLQPDDYDNSEAITQIRHALKTGSAARVLLRNQRKDGSRFWNDLTITPVKDAFDQVTHFVGMQIDVTEIIDSRKHAQEHEERYTNLFRAMDEGYCIIEIQYDDQGVPDNYRFIEANNAFQKQTGLTHPVGKTVRELIPNIEEKWIKKYAEVAKKGHTKRFTSDSDALGRTFDVFASKIGGRDEPLVALIFSDITEKIQAETALENQLHLTRKITDNASAALFLIDEFGKITYMNSSAETITGYRYQSALGNTLHRLIHHTKPNGEAYPEDTCDLTKIYLSSKNLNPREEIFYRKNGKPFPGLIQITSTTSKTEKNVGIVEIRDLSIEKAAIEEAKDSSQRRIELEDYAKQLLEQKQQLTEMNHAKDEFISIASHQLRTPATGVKQYIGLVREGYAGEINELAEKYLSKADESNDRQLNIIDDLLKIAALDSNRITLEKTIFTVSDLVHDIVAEQTKSFVERNQKIIVRIPKDIEIWGDKNYIRMALDNLIENAIKYSHNGKTIIISVRKLKETVKISVKDNGVGIAAKDIPKLFQKFSRIDNPLSISSGGSGLGLYWTQEVIKLHDGRIEVKSQLDSGTDFIVYLPKH